MAAPACPLVQPSQGRSCVLQGQAQRLLGLVALVPGRTSKVLKSKPGEGRGHGRAQRVSPAGGTKAGDSETREDLPEGGHRGEGVKPVSFLGILRESPGATAQA